MAKLLDLQLITSKIPNGNLFFFNFALLNGGADFEFIYHSCKNEKLYRVVPFSWNGITADENSVEYSIESGVG